MHLTPPIETAGLTIGTEMDHASLVLLGFETCPRSGGNLDRAGFMQMEDSSFRTGSWAVFDDFAVNFAELWSCGAPQEL